MHLLLPYAAALDPGCDAAARGLALPNLERLLARVRPSDADPGDEFTLSPPHERALARVLGFAPVDGQLPWAAHSLAAAGQDPAAQPCAWVTPCHWQVATDHISLLDPDGLELDDAESQALLALVAPYFAEDGIVLDYLAPARWRARGAPLRGVATASLDRVRGRSLDDWMPAGPESRLLRRLQSELQMLLYTHPLTDARNARGRLAVNAFWFSGTGPWTTTARAEAPELVMPDGLRAAALKGDWAGWAQAWRQIDGDACGALLAANGRGETVRLTLCGERSALSFASGSQTAWTRLTAKFKSLSGRLRMQDLRHQL